MPLYKATITTTVYFVSEAKGPNLLMEAEGYMKKHIRNSGLDAFPEPVRVRPDDKPVEGWTGQDYVYGTGRRMGEGQMTLAAVQQEEREKILTSQNISRLGL